MPNYKRFGDIELHGGVISKKLHNSQKPINLQIIHSTGSSPLSMKNCDSTQSKYTVTAGKKLVILAFYYVVSNTGTAGNWWIYQGDTDGAITTLKIKMSVSVAGYDQRQWFYPNTEISIAAGKYVVSDPSTTSIAYVGIIGYEEDA